MESKPKLIAIRGVLPPVALGIGSAVGAALQGSAAICVALLLITTGYVAVVAWVAAVRWQYWSELSLWGAVTPADANHTTLTKSLEAIKPPRSLAREHKELVDAYRVSTDSPRFKTAWDEIMERMTGQRPSADDWDEATT